MSVPVTVSSSPPRRRLRAVPSLSVALGRVVLLALVLLGWKLAASHSAAAGTLSSPWATAQALGRLAESQEFWTAVYHTVRSALIGLACSTVAGTVVGLMLASRRFAYQSASLVIDFLRTVPGLAIMPLGILVFGPTERLDLLMIVTAAVWPILLQTVYAATQLDAELLETAAAYKIPLWRRFLFVMLPACLPRIATGIRISAAMAVLLAIGTEILAGSPGLGAEISLSEQQAAYPTMYAGILACGVLGLACNTGIVAVERVTLRWHFQPRRIAQ